MDNAHREDLSHDDRFVALLAANQQNLRAFILSLIPSQMDADDLLQETYMALWKKREWYFEKDIEFIRWAIGFVSIEIRRFRSRATNAALWFHDDTIELLADEWVRPDSFADDSRAALKSCIQKLGDTYQNVIEDKYMRRLTAKQIAQRTGKPLSTIYRIMSKALDMLRECVERTQRQLDQ